jgi:MtaA/CmuA family methyltransferase
VLVEANIRCAEDFGMEQLSAISDPYRETEGFGGEIVFHENAVPECVRPPLADDRDLDRLPVPDPRQARRMRDRIDAIRLMRERTGDRYSVLGWVEGPAAEAVDLRGVSSFLMELLDDPDWCGGLMDRCTATAIDFALAQVEAGADTIGIGDAICSQISPGVYEEQVLPRQQRLCAAIREAGARVRLHICGQTRHLWNGFRQLPLDLVDVDHLVDMTEIRAALGPGQMLVGNLDPSAELRFGEPARIRDGLERVRRAAGARWMVSAGCEIPSGTPVENLAALCEPLDPD